MVLDTGTEVAAAAPKGIWSWITTVDHKRIGIMYGATGLVAFFVAGLEALLIRMQLLMTRYSDLGRSWSCLSAPRS